MKKYERYIRKYDKSFEGTLNELLNIIDYLNTTGVGELLESGHNLKLHDIYYNHLDKLGYTDDDFETYCNIAYADFIDDVKISTSVEFDDLVEYAGRTSTFYFKISGQTCYDNTITEAIELAYLDDQHVDNIIDSINDALEVIELMEYYKNIETFKVYMDDE